MKRSVILLFKVLIVLIGIGALALLLWEPHLEGRNAHATLFEIYFKDPFLALVYVGSIPFFAVLYKAFKVLGYAGQNMLFSQATVNALRTIKYCAFTIIGFVVVEEVIIILNHGNDDAAGGIFMGILITFGSIIVVTATTMFERIVHKILKMKPENKII
ncbi:MAG: DUF2975 domain-containing protein [Patescibacteria group bacterium]|mgnify:CR=1 FL=1